MQDVRLVFIGGCPRSGTTLIKRMLDAHKDIYCGPEFGHLFSICERYKRMKQGVAQERIAVYADDALLREIYRNFILTFLTRAASSIPVKVIAEKTPDNIFAFPELAEIFPEAKFIEVIRNPLDVVASYLRVGDRVRQNDLDAIKKSKNENSPFNSAKLAAQRWRKSVKYLERFEGVLNDVRMMNRYMRIRYEDVVNAPKKSARQLALFLGVANSDSMFVDGNSSKGDPTKFGGKFYTDDEYFSPIHKSRVGVWEKELTEVQIREVLNEVEREVLELGYVAYLQRAEKLSAK